MPRADGYWTDDAGRESSKRNCSVVVDERKRATDMAALHPIIGVRTGWRRRMP
jgi:hypothetical protein